LQTLKIFATKDIPLEEKKRKTKKRVVSWFCFFVVPKKVVRLRIVSPGETKSQPCEWQKSAFNGNL